MSFATPLWLLLLGVLPLIVLLHMVALRWKAIPVSSLRFWDRVLKERRTSARIRRILRNLLLLLELLAAAGLAFALAGPRLSVGGFASAGNVILVMDASASMQTREGERTRFDLARAQATRVVAGLRRGSRMAIVAAAHAPRLVQPWTDDHQTLDRVLAGLRATDEPADISQSMLFALSLRDPRRGDAVVLVSDCAFDSLPDIDTSVPWMRILSVGTPKENVGITALSLRRTLGGEETYELFLSVRNYTAASVTVPVTVTAGATQVLAESLTLAAREEREISEPWRGPTSGPIVARIDHRDDFPLDDQAYAVLAPSRQIRVNLVGPGNPFLEQALASLPGVVLEEAAPEEWDHPARPGGRAWRCPNR